MPDSAYYRAQADRFDRVADDCAVPELVPYYRKLAQDYRSRADGGAASDQPEGRPSDIEFPE